jgi:hypothetical protein
VVCNHEVTGSIPVSSTRIVHVSWIIAFQFFDNQDERQ